MSSLLGPSEHLSSLVGRDSVASQSSIAKLINYYVRDAILFPGIDEALRYWKTAKRSGLRVEVC